MINKKQARDVAHELINLSTHLEGDVVDIVDYSTVEKKNAWIFFWDSKKYIETNDIRHALGGNAPVLVYKDSGKGIFLGTAKPLDVYLCELGVE